MGFFQDLQQDLSRIENNELVVKPEEIDTEIEIVIYDEAATQTADYADDIEVTEAETVLAEQETAKCPIQIEADEFDEIEELEEIEVEAESSAEATVAIDEVASTVENAEVAELSEEVSEVIQSQPAAGQEFIKDTAEDKKNVSAKMKAVITQGMSIFGDLKTKDSVEIAGEIIGHVESGGEVRVTKNGVIVGNITAVNVVIAGAVKGDIKVSEKLVLERTAIVSGNIEAKAVKISEGAVMEGTVSLGKKRDNAMQIFEKYLTES